MKHKIYIQRKEKQEFRDIIKSGDYCKCKNCGHVGYVYGAPSFNIGICHPWCQNCGINNQLIKSSKEK